MFVLAKISRDQEDWDKDTIVYGPFNTVEEVTSYVNPDMIRYGPYDILEVLSVTQIPDEHKAQGG